MGMRRNPAIVAGLIGAACLAEPGVACGAPLEGAVDLVLAEPARAFAAGVAIGALAALGTVGLVALVVRQARSRSGARAAAADVEAGAASADETSERPARAPKHMRTEPEAEEAPAPQPSRRSRRAAGAQPPRQAPRASHAATDYEQIAVNQARRASFSERMALRAQGVAATLRDRMGAGMMDGIPVIARADGSVGDVGTSWWQAAVGPDAIIRDSGFAMDEDSFAIPSSFSADGRSQLLGAAQAAAPRTGDTAPRPVSAAGTSGRVANVGQGACPEAAADGGAEDDDWAAALRSLDERIVAEAALFETVEFSDAVGGIDTLDEPDNLELPTSFIPFKTPAGHPEVVDAESYVDYLIGDEFEKNSSPAARHSSRRFLRVLQGGTQPSSRHLADTAEDEPIHEGKHFAVAREA